MDDVRDISKKIRQQQKEMEDLQRDIRNLKSENEKQQGEVNQLYFITIVLGVSLIISALGTVIH